MSAISSGEVIIFTLLSSGGIVVGLLLLFTFLNLSHTFLVRVLEFIEFTNLFHIFFLAFLKILCLMTLLHWNDLSLVVSVGLTILSSLSHSSFHHATSGLLFVSGDVWKWFL